MYDDHKPYSSQYDTWFCAYSLPVSLSCKVKGAHSILICMDLSYFGHVQGNLKIHTVVQCNLLTKDRKTSKILIKYLMNHKVSRMDKDGGSFHMRTDLHGLQMTNLKN